MSFQGHHTWRLASSAVDIAQRVERWPSTQESLTCGCPPFTCGIPRTTVPLDSTPWWLVYHPITKSLAHLRDGLKSIFYPLPLLWLVCNPSGSHVESVSKTLQTHHFFATTIPPSSVPWATHWAAPVPSLPSSNLFSTQQPEIQFLFL